jgi:uncharacterized protein YcbX
MLDASQNLLGSVHSLWRYPVKSMQGEPLEAVDVTERGLLGDRAYALLDGSTSKVASAKNSRKWEELLQFRASFATPPRLGERLPPVRITFPDGRVESSERSNIDHILSEALDREVRLTATPPRAPRFEECAPESESGKRASPIREEDLALGAPAGTFFDFAPIHLVTTATLERLQELHPQGRVDARRFRPNIVVAPRTGGSGFVENDWLRQTLAIGSDVRLYAATPCPRCVMTTLPQGELARDPLVFQTVALHAKAFFAPLAKSLPSVGIYATVSRGGRLRCGDALRGERTPLGRRGAFWFSLIRTVVERRLR